MTLCTTQDLVDIVDAAVATEETRALRQNEQRCPLPLRVIAVLHAIIVSEMVPRTTCVSTSVKGAQPHPGFSPADCEAALRWTMGVPRRLLLPRVWERELLPPSFIETRRDRGSAKGSASPSSGTDHGHVDSDSDDDDEAMDVAREEEGRLRLRRCASELLDRLAMLHERVEKTTAGGIRPPPTPFVRLSDTAGEKGMVDHDIKVERFFFGPLGPMYRGRDVPSVMFLDAGSMLRAATVFTLDAVAQRSPVLLEPYSKLAARVHNEDLSQSMSVLDFIHRGHRMSLPIGTELPRVSLVPRR
mmetsp:Transcript_14908/g.56558  ORF Transcript_14908/g.56558 Transcript_14908/m.56558 type:complete len:301 (-) Transcript_14908:220-1122(-)